MGRLDHPKGATLRAQREGMCVFIPTDAPMGRAMRRYLERENRLMESRARVKAAQRKGGEL